MRKDPSLIRIGRAAAIGCAMLALLGSVSRAQHLTPDGMILRQNGTAVVNVWQGAESGKFDFPPTVSTGRIDVSFLDEFGVEFTPVDPQFSLQWNAPNPVIATISQVDTWAFQMTGVNPGTTTLQIRIWHVTHTDWTSPVIAVRTVGTSGVGPPPLTLALELSPPAPNPASLSTLLRFALPRSEPVRLFLFDTAGRQVRSFTDGSYDAGPHALTVDTAALPAGRYQLLLEGSGGVRTQPLIVVH